MASPVSAGAFSVPEDGCSTSSAIVVSATVGSEQLGAFQRRLLINNWNHLTKTGSQGISNVMFQKFMGKRPETRKLFTAASVVGGFSGEKTNCLADHVRLLTDLIDKAIQGIDNLAETGKLCVQIGAAHIHLHSDTFNAETWDKFGQTMLEAVTQLESVRKHKELVRAWMVLISFLIDKIRQGYSTGLRRLKFQSARAMTCKDDGVMAQAAAMDSFFSKSQNEDTGGSTADPK